MDLVFQTRRKMQHGPTWNILGAAHCRHPYTLTPISISPALLSAIYPSLLSAIYPSLLSAYTLHSYRQYTPHSYQHVPLTPISIPLTPIRIYPSLLSAWWWELKIGRKSEVFGMKFSVVDVRTSSDIILIIYRGLQLPYRKESKKSSDFIKLQSPVFFCLSTLLDGSVVTPVRTECSGAALCH